MPPRVLQTIDLTIPSGNVGVGASSAGSKLWIDNESNYFVEFSSGYGTVIFPPWMIDVLYFDGPIQSIAYRTVAELNSDDPPEQSLYMVYYDESDKLRGTFPIATNRQSNVGNPLVSQPRSIILTDAIPGESVLQIIKSGTIFAQVYLTADGQLLLSDVNGKSKLFIDPATNQAVVGAASLPTNLRVWGKLILGSGGWVDTGATWQPLIFQNGFFNYGTYATGSYFKDAQGFVHLRGLINSPVTGFAASTTIADLPVGFRPNSGPEIFSVQSAIGSGRLDVQTASGQIAPQFASASQAWISLSGISFYAGY